MVYIYQKKIVELHNGKIYVNDKLKDATEFIFYMPIQTIEGELLDIKVNKSDLVEKCNIEFSDIYTYVL